MNKHILFVMRSLDNPELFTQEEKEANKIAAYAAYDAAAAAADAAYAAYAADVDAYAAYGADAADVEYWVNLFFKRSGEDKHVYIDEVERLKGNNTMNKHILFVMRSLDNTELFTQEEKEANKNSASTAASTAAYAYAAASTAAYAYAAAAYAAADAHTAADAAHAAERWVKEFFIKTSEDEQTYINEVERLKGNNTMHYDEQRETAMEQQVGGTHYKDLGVQPLELTLKNMGFLAFEGACYTKINKYMIRNKDNKVEQLKKAQHVLSMWIEAAEKQQ